MMDIDQRNQAPEDENKLIAQRREKLHQIRQLREAFPNDFDRTDQSEQIHRAHGCKDVQELQAEARRVSVAGRIIRARGPFVVIQDGYGQLQLYMNNKTFDEQQATELKALDLGDIVGAKGELFKTQRGELTVRVSEFRLLTKALRPLPDKHRGLSDTETRYRQRYVDLIANDASRQIFAIRSRIVRCIRDYFHDRGFMEVETPMMQVIPGGATARPFTTHHNALDQDMYLRIAPELFLKRLTVGGYEKVFELNRNFRNEGLSTRHNPEFTMLEFYWAYARYDDLMDLTEDLFRSIANEVLGSCSVRYQDMEFDFAKPFARLTVKEAVSTYCKLGDSVDLDDVKSLTREAKRLGVSFDENWPKGKVLMEIFEQQVEESLEQPTFITEYPIEVSPLARRNENNPEVTDRFELIVGGRELANGFSELNDPEDQAARFHAQVAQKDAGDQEAMHFDEDYITALEYGMPPTAGEGIGIDRLVMLFTNSASIKDVLLFPHMRPRQDDH
ncbi:MAG: lysine--tRNA ligase [Pseudomonadota bacterium]|nr:lysine--tRNA ligase [Pseudomonadota bacterium]MEC8453704.1 lysine--tRNA ligase [Pseudomonadota bacterium]MEC8588440.1 lysine--tRNA ligase [Pseudomonadota bacterium]MEC8741394.1 lysine--tRNA ligase [Pseudomonadota bacterium]